MHECQEKYSKLWMDLILNQHLIKSLNIIKYNHKIIFYRMVQKCNQNCNSKNKTKIFHYYI